MSENIPFEIINKILFYRERHPLRDVICCMRCKYENYFRLYIYYRPTSSFSKFQILCDDCNYEMEKD